MVKPAGLVPSDDGACLAAGAAVVAAGAEGLPIGTVAVGMEIVGVPAFGTGMAGWSGEDAGTPAARRRVGGTGAPAPGRANGMVAAGAGAVA